MKNENIRMERDTIPVKLIRSNIPLSFSPEYFIFICSPSLLSSKLVGSLYTKNLLNLFFFFFF